MLRRHARPPFPARKCYHVQRFLAIEGRKMSSPESAYVMGHTDCERRRLALKASVINPLTDTFLRRAGVSAGMRVLDRTMSVMGNYVN
jgi:hypothetical protein